MNAILDPIPEFPEIFGEARQVAYIVDNLDEAINRWHSEHGVGPFLVARKARPLNNALYRGRKARDTRVNIAFAYVGDMQLELIELIGDTPSLYKEALDREDYGVNHYAVCVEDFPAAYHWGLDNGFTPVVDAGVDGLARMSYLERIENNERLILEVIEWNPLTRPYFDELARMAAQANPEQLIHEFSLADLTPRGAVLLQLLKFTFNKALGRIPRTLPIDSAGTS